ncbi:Thioredoxin-like protein [Glarea lozoyensis ATCC 20868]|uniref:Thioredoxin-like protein n=1 Tax=Glarea lozoyensis (strain ATCC 20868 / MF5171) TaxID=1116229 RepID=S3CIC7_GLAL2|nr:Thioredoxin-like protein [Glarea lozoyensis ATCC 20868]EPE26237.1 Thioredoxin-like protein [Glarea lozoyensis ATCC 20868]
MTIKVGDSIPSIEALQESKPGNGVDLKKEIGSGDAVIVGVPAAFSPTCSDSHIPGYINHSKIKDVGKVFVISVNDPFVMSAWGSSLTKQFGDSPIRFLADPAGKFTREIGLEFESAAMLGTNRSKRYAIVVKGGKVEKVEVEPDNVGAVVSVAEKILG